MNTALTNITIATTNATGIGSPSGLPGGVTASWSSNTTTISGTPNASGTFNYSIPILTGGFDISAATYVHSFSVAPQDTGPRELAFSSDGTKFFIVGFTACVRLINIPSGPSKTPNKNPFLTFRLAFEHILRFCNP